MKFSISRNYQDTVLDAADAINFLREAFESGKLNEIENFDELIEALDISGELEYAHQRLKDYNIDL